jgi:hypothetical protein
MMEMIPAMMIQMRICEKYQARKPIAQMIRMMKKSLFFWYKVLILQMLLVVIGVDKFRIASGNFHPGYTKILLFSEKRIARQSIV